MVSKGAMQKWKGFGTVMFKALNKPQYQAQARSDSGNKKSTHLFLLPVEWWRKTNITFLYPYFKHLFVITLDVCVFSEGHEDCGEAGLLFFFMNAYTLLASKNENRYKKKEQLSSNIWSNMPPLIKDIKKEQILEEKPEAVFLYIN